MKLKDGYIVREVAGQIVALPTGDELDLNKMIILNDTAKFLWDHLQQETDEEQLTTALLSEYEVDEPTAAAAVASFVAKMQENGFTE